MSDEKLFDQAARDNLNELAEKITPSLVRLEQIMKDMVRVLAEGREHEPGVAEILRDCGIEPKETA